MQKPDDSISLDELPWEEALRLICKNNNLGYTINGNNIRIAPIEKLLKEEQHQRFLEKIEKQ